MEDTVLYQDIRLRDFLTVECIAVHVVTGKYGYLLIEKKDLVILIELAVGTLAVVCDMSLHEALKYIVACRIYRSLSNERILVECSVHGSPKGIDSCLVEERVGTVSTASVENSHEVGQF